MAISRGARYSKKRRRAKTNATGSRSKFKRGYYKPLNENKYQQPLDKTMNSQQYPEYRSSWELKLMKWCDSNADVEYWTTEPFAVPYVKPTDNQIHRYFPDFLIKFKDGTKWLIEIKPQNQWDDPINIAKWNSAKEFCLKNGLIFRVMGEKELGIKP